MSVPVPTAVAQQPVVASPAVVMQLVTECLEKTSSAVLFLRRLAATIKNETITDALGSVRTILTKKVSYQAESGEEILVGCITDITELKDVELALRRSEARFRSLIQNATDIVIILDRKGQVQYRQKSAPFCEGVPVHY